MTEVSASLVLRFVVKLAPLHGIRQHERRSKAPENDDKKASTPQYVVGQRVLVQCSHKLPGISSKLQQKYDGP